MAGATRTVRPRRAWIVRPRIAAIAPIPVARLRPPAKTSAVAALNADATAPVRRPPIGVDPAKTVVYTLITRPRRWSGTSSWTRVLAVAAMAMPPTPQKNIARSAIPNELVPPSTTSAMPSVAPPSPITTGTVLPENAIDKALRIEPTPVAAIRKP
jgi:hypothetical protein